MVPVPAAAAADPAFDWTMPGHLGADEDEDGLVDYAGTAAQFKEDEQRRDGFQVDLAVRRDLCRKTATYLWKSEAGTTIGRGAAGCQASQRFASEGEHEVQLTVRYAGGKAVTFEREVSVQDWLIVSIGDSVASGEGNPDHRGRLLPGSTFRARWQSPRCHRSAKAGPALTALDLEKSDPRTTTTFVHLACSGAQIEKGLLGGYKGIDVDKSTDPRVLPPQVEELEQIREGRQIDAVLLSIGANDVYFGPIVKFCLFTKKCMEKDFRPPQEEGEPKAAKMPLEQVVKEALARLPIAYEELAERLADIVGDPSHVIPVEYFDPTKDSEGNPCERFLPRGSFGFVQIDRQEAEWAASKLLQPLNEKLRNAAKEAEWTTVTGVAERFRTHGYCASQPWVVRILESVRKQKGISRGSLVAGGFHPNEIGHREEAGLILPVLEGTLETEAQDGEDTVVVTVDRGDDPDGDEGGEGDAEKIGGALLAALAALLATAVGLISRRSTRPRGEIPWDAPAAGEDPSLPPLPSWDPEPDSVAAFGALVENQAEWVHRRVESIDLVDDRIVRRRVSVDFTPGNLRAFEGACLAPIALLSKQVLTRFDLRDEEGRSVPLATSEQNARFATEYMLQLAAEATGESPSAWLRELCWKIARGKPEESRRAIEEMAQRLEPESTRLALRKSQRFRAATTTFAASFAVMVEVDDPNRRRVLKFSYDQQVRDELRWRQRLGLDPAAILIELPELGDAGSRHIEFVRAEGLEFWSDHLYAMKPNGKVVRRSGGRATGEAHLDIGGMPRGTRALAGVFMRAARSGILVGGPLLAFLSAAALTGAWFALPGLAHDSTGAASILLAVPAALGAYLSARHPHPMEAAMLTGARALVFLSGALAFAGAAALALGLSVEALRWLLGTVALLGWLTTAGLLVTLILPRPPARR